MRYDSIAYAASELSLYTEQKNMRKPWILLVGLFLSPCLYGQTAFTFMTPESGTSSYPWGISSNWSSGIPDTSTPASITFPTGNPRVLVESYDLMGNSYAYCSSLGLNGAGLLYIQDDGAQAASLFVNGGLNNSDGASGIYFQMINHSSNSYRTLTLQGTNTSAYNGSLSGSGTFNLSLTSGSFTMTGDATLFAGPTNLNGGTFYANSSTALSPTSQYNFANALNLMLVVGANPTAGSISGGGTTGGSIYLNNGCTLTVSSGGSYNGAISGPGSLALSGGTLTLTNTTSNYTGATTVNGGTLAVIGSVSGTSSVNVASGGVLSLTGALSSTGSVDVESGGSLTVANAATLASSSIIVGGTFSAAGQVTNTNSISINSGAAFDLAATGVLSSASMAVGGALTVEGTISHAGAVTIDSGGTFSITGNVTSTSMTIEGSLTVAGTMVNTTNAVTVESGGTCDVTGTGTLTSHALVASGGTFTISGHASASNSVSIRSGGTLAVPGTLSGAGPVTINNGGLLTGTGTIAHLVTVNDGGVISPGNTTAILTLLSNLTLNSGSQTTIEVNAEEDHATIAVVGAANLNGTLFLQPDAGNYADFPTYTVLTAANLNNSSFDSVVAYGFKAVPSYIRIPGNSAVSVQLFPLNLHTIGEFSGNAKAVASYLISLRFLPFMQPVLLDLYELSHSQLQAALNAISPSRNSFSTFAVANTNFTLTSTLSDRLASQRQIHLTRKRNAADLFLTQNQETLPYGSSQVLAREEYKYDLWIESIGELAHQAAQSQNPNFHFNTGGALIGFDRITPKGQIGWMVGYTDTDISDGSNAGQATVQFTGTALYGNFYFGQGYLELGLLGGYNRYTNNRHIVFPGFDAHAKSSHDGSSYVPRMAIGYDFHFDQGNMEPFASVDCAFVLQNKFYEHGAAPLNMKQSRTMAELLRCETGFHFYEDWIGDCWAIILKEKLSYIYQKGFSLGKLSSMAIVGAPGGFTVNTFTKVQNLFSPAFELFVKWKDRWFFSANYEGEFGNGYTTNEVSSKLGCYF